MGGKGGMYTKSTYRKPESPLVRHMIINNLPEGEELHVAMFGGGGGSVAPLNDLVRLRLLCQQDQCLKLCTVHNLFMYILYTYSLLKGPHLFFFLNRTWYSLSLFSQSFPIRFTTSY